MKRMGWLMFNTMLNLKILALTTQPAFTCSNLIIETLEQDVKYVHMFVLVSLVCSFC